MNVAWHRPVKEQIPRNSMIGFVFIFNLIVGTGALTLPFVFAQAGWLLSSLVVTLLAFISYITVTFMIETMACANAVRNWQQSQFIYDMSDDDSDDSQPLIINSARPRLSRSTNLPVRSNIHTPEMEHLTATYPVQNYYSLDRRLELGEMASLFFKDTGRVFFYLCVATYLYGDLSIYTAAVAKSLRDITCLTTNSSVLPNITRYNFADTQEDDGITPCWPEHTISRLQMYRMFVIGFTVVLGPFAYFSVQNTKYLQICTAAFRWTAFATMITVALSILLSKGAAGHPPTANIYGVPPLFGACIYSFMCHHSLPSLLTPISDKQKIRSIISYDYILICTFYIVLSLTGAFAFAELQDLYTLNFIPDTISGHMYGANVLLAIEYFLTLYPVFTLSTTYPIIAITLRNNLQTFFLDMERFDSYNYFLRKILFPLLAVVPPFIITYFTESITSLVAFTGSYSGAGIQCIIPICLVYFARQTCTELLGNGIVNSFRSPFQSKYWLLFILFWSLICICLVTIDFWVDIKPAF
ncbi:PREDICTED: transmembrane protein 104 homolog isoform X2 [Rhagoletis zephyria]|uniref:transmembrane protein 104 homolog isoform X2 n=1 Tax=Rhagoletis zephyria TaxID=28612 RepID=UPI000811A082|nr:PREDICTED: transmembrane protein 104 homolog isoform X2 [Rhagoletis zephyria]XP_036335155.1 transmembrane protein 104 homolog isoform X2 [Rhagoletis pomonella]